MTIKSETGNDDVMSDRNPTTDHASSNNTNPTSADCDNNRTTTTATTTTATATSLSSFGKGNVNHLTSIASLNQIENVSPFTCFLHICSHTFII